MSPIASSPRERRKFIVADTPGHEQYTRNMATGASNADLAVILIDARKGVLTQTRRHAIIVSLLGIRHVVLAVNKIDLVDYDQRVFDDDRRRLSRVRRRSSASRTSCAIPLSARFGDNVSPSSAETPWYRGPASARTSRNRRCRRRTCAAAPFRLPVQWVNRPNLDFRGFAGTIASGRVEPGRRDRRRCHPGAPRRSSASSPRTAICRKRAAGRGGHADAGRRGRHRRGDVLAADARPPAGRRPVRGAPPLDDATSQMLPGPPYLLKIGTQLCRRAGHRPQAQDRRQHAASTSPPRRSSSTKSASAISRSTAPIAFDPYATTATPARFILIDRFTNATVGAGMIEFRAAARDQHPLAGARRRQGRRAPRIKHQKPACSGSPACPARANRPSPTWSKQALHARGRAHHHARRRQCAPRAQPGSRLHRRRPRREHPPRRRGRQADGRCRPDRAGRFISPFRAERRMARDLVDAGEFIEIFVDTPLEVCDAARSQGAL